ncbi:amidohydrolase [Peredibacter sp. HCB2-198]|uniref:amidohydrolase n=1 Tax=Peredibacter sp. HCB2-198 TaxID=3383025 RepID=UPI0038B4F7DB
MKVIDAITVTSTLVQRQQIQFDEANGLIMAVGDLNLTADYTFGNDCYLFAGMGDVHIHAREDVSGKNNYKEDFTTARMALRNGGLCHAGDMPNNPVPPVDEKSYEAKVKLAEKVEGEIWAYAGIGPETRPLSYSVPYKVYMGPSIGELFFKDLPTLEHTLEHYRGENVSFHCEDPLILEAHKSATHHHDRRPVEAEVIATKDALMMIQKFNLKGKLCHYSSGEGLRLIREARSQGVEVQIEVTPQHLFYDIEHILEKDLKVFQMNPPIRHEYDRSALLMALKNGEIDFLATDHAPHTHEEKEKGTSGLTGLDTFGPFVTWLIDDQGFDPKLIAKVAAENPGDFFNQFLPSWQKISKVYSNMGDGVGYLKPGYRANFTVLNMKRPLTVDRQNLKTKVGHSPFMGVTFPGSVEALFIGGQKV